MTTEPTRLSLFFVLVLQNSNFTLPQLSDFFVFHKPVFVPINIRALIVIIYGELYSWVCSSGFERLILEASMEEEKDAFYVVRKGDVVGIYKSLKDCQNQAGSSVCNPSVSVFKGYGLPKEAEEYLVSHGLKNASYTISASDVKDGIFGDLVACPYQQPASSMVKSFVNDSPPKRLPDMMFPSASSFPPYNKHFKADNCNETRVLSSTGQSCILEFDGASKGNPGLSGAGAVLRAEDGSVLYRLREGVGIATNNVAEYRAVILGLKFALDKGYKHIRVKGDSKLVCCQIEGVWKTKNQNMADLCQVAKQLKEKFTSFEINHVLREFNAEADVLANRAINLRDGQVAVEF